MLSRAARWAALARVALHGTVLVYPLVVLPAVLVASSPDPFALVEAGLVVALARHAGSLGLPALLLVWTEPVILLARRRELGWRTAAPVLAVTAASVCHLAPEVRGRVLASAVALVALTIAKAVLPAHTSTTLDAALRAKDFKLLASLLAALVALFVLAPPRPLLSHYSLPDVAAFVLYLALVLADRFSDAWLPHSLKGVMLDTSSTEEEEEEDVLPRVSISKAFPRPSFPDHPQLEAAIRGLRHFSWQIHLVAYYVLAHSPIGVQVAYLFPTRYGDYGFVPLILAITVFQAAGVAQKLARDSSKKTRPPSKRGLTSPSTVFIEAGTGAKAANRGPLMAVAGAAFLLALYLLSGMFDFPLPATYHNTSHTLDIVFTHHKEPLPEFSDLLKTVLDVPYIQSFLPTSPTGRVRVVVYTKSSVASADDIRPVLAGAGIHEKGVVVRDVPNVGREGETYLHHLVNYWDSLADQTIFLQPHMAWDWVFLPRLRLMGPRTSFLSLGPYVPNYAGVERREDNKWQSGNYTGVKLVWEALREEMPSRQTAAWSGAIVVARDRVLSRPKAAYARLLDLISAEENHAVHKLWGPNPPSSYDRSNPVFGHSIERSWPAIFNCSDYSISQRCRHDTWSVKACQCRS